MQSECYESGYRIDLYFHDYRLAIEIDEFDQCDRDIEYEEESERIPEEKLNCVFIRINPDEEDFNCFKAINKIHRHINKSTRKLTKKFVIDDVKRLLKAGSKFSNNDAIFKFTKNFAGHILPTR